MSDHKSLSRSEMTIVNLFTSALAWGWPVLLAFVATPLIVHGLGNDAYGIRGLVIAITGYFALLDLGLNGAVTKFLAEYLARNDKPLITELLGTTLTTYTVFGLLGGVLIWALAEWFTTTLFVVPPEFYQQAIWAFRLTGVGFFLSMITWWGSSIPAGTQRFDVFNGISIGFGTITTLGTVAAVLMGYGLIGVVIANLLANFIAIVAYWVAIRKLLPEIPLRFSFERGMFKRTVLFGLYMVGFRIFGLLFAQLDTLLIGRWIGMAAITLYTVPQQVAQIVHGINGKMMQIIFPMVSEFAAVGDREKIERVFVRGFNLSLVIGLAVAIPLVVVAEPLLRFWMSPEIARQSAIVMEILVLTFLLAGLTAIPVNFLGGVNYPQLVTLGSVVSGVSGLFFYLLLIKPLGIAGAALGKLIGIVFTLAYYAAVCKWKGGIPFFKVFRTAIKPVALAAVVGVLGYLFITPYVNSLLKSIIVAALIAGVYGCICWLLGVFRKDEKQSLLSLYKHFISSPRKSSI